MAGSTLLLDEFFASEDPRFLQELFASTAEKKLQVLGAAWAGDARPFARAALLDYLDDGCDRPHHRALVKKLFKTLEERGDDEAMGHFLVAFDRLVHREIATPRWGGEPVIRHPRTKQKFVVEEVTREGVNPFTRQVQKITSRVKKPVPQSADERFSRLTRQYLKRRAFRYFRRLGHADVARYGRAIRAALALYRDEDLQKPIDLLDAWGLCHAIYGESEVLYRHPRGVLVAEGRTLGELAPAPMFPEAWRGVFAEVFALALEARSRPVRRFALAIVEKDHAGDLRRLSISDVGRLIRSSEPDLAALGARLLPDVAGLDNLPLADWLDLLRLEDPVVVTTVCGLVERRVSPERINLAQAVDLASARPTPVAELGLRWVKAKPRATAAALAELARLTRAENPGVRVEAVRFYVEVLEQSAFATHERVRDLFDAAAVNVRAEGIAVVGRSPRFQDDTALWAALSESPYPDVRAFLIRHLATRQKVLLADERARLWASTLLAVFRGSREKRIALGQIADRLVKAPADAKALVPLLAFALRSVREAERRSALAAVARAAFRSPELRRELVDAVPELGLGALETA